MPAYTTKGSLRSRRPQPTHRAPLRRPSSSGTPSASACRSRTPAVSRLRSASPGSHQADIDAARGLAFTKGYSVIHHDAEGHLRRERRARRDRRTRAHWRSHQPSLASPPSQPQAHRVQSHPRPRALHAECRRATSYATLLASHPKPRRVNQASCRAQAAAAAARWRRER